MPKGCSIVLGYRVTGYGFCENTTSNSGLWPRVSLWSFSQKIQNFAAAQTARAWLEFG